MTLNGYIACICEGSFEEAVIELLLDKNKLIFSYEDLLEEKIIRERSAKKFEQRYLRKGFNNKITILRILDSKKERFKLSKAYENKVDVINIITAPEIEMLIICNENHFSKFKNSKMKPSEYCKIKLNYKNVKNEDFVKNYFSNIDSLIHSIKEYKRVGPNDGQKRLFDLLK